mgnify:CR=1 FL=1
MVPTNKPQNKLNGIEYLLLSIQSNPGKSQRWHLRRKHMYQHGRPDYHKGGSGCGYFNSPSYRNVLWVDKAPQDIKKYSWGGGGYRSRSAEMHLTRRGWTRANEVRAKLGLPYKGRPPRLDYSAM